MQQHAGLTQLNARQIQAALVRSTRNYTHVHHEGFLVSSISIGSRPLYDLFASGVVSVFKSFLSSKGLPWHIH